MATIANVEITVKDQLRPALYWNERDKGTEPIKVLVHITKTGRHGGYMLELEGGEMVEAVEVGSNGCHLKFCDSPHEMYAFDKVVE